MGTVTRQDLPAEAFCPVDAAQKAVDEEYGAFVVSHGWLAEHHPDPEATRRRAGATKSSRQAKRFPKSRKVAQNRAKPRWHALSRAEVSLSHAKSC